MSSLIFRLAGNCIWRSLVTQRFVSSSPRLLSQQCIIESGPFNKKRPSKYSIEVKLPGPIDPARLNSSQFSNQLVNDLCATYFSKYDEIYNKSSSRRVFIKGIPETIDEKALLKVFSPFGRIKKSKITFYDNSPAKVGFIEFENEEQVKVVLENLDRTMLDQNSISVSQFRSEHDNYIKLLSTFTRLSIKGLSYKMTSDQLRDIFSPFGNISYCDIMTDSKGNSNLKGIVKYEEHHQAVAAIEALHGKVFGVNRLHVSRTRSRKEARFCATSNLKLEFSPVPENEIISGQTIESIRFTDISPDISDEQIFYIFQSQGKINKFEIRLDELGGRSGLVTYQNYSKDSKILDDLMLRYPFTHKWDLKKTCYTASNLNKLVHYFPYPYHVAPPDDILPPPTPVSDLSDKIPGEPNNS